jgi:two-component system sensor histidine kinase GlrK
MTLVGLGLLTLPLLLAVGAATLKLDDLTRESSDVASAIQTSTLESQRVQRALNNMERDGRSYLFLHGTEPGEKAFDRYRTAAANLKESLATLEAEQGTEAIVDDFALLRRTAARVTATVESASSLPADADTAPSEEAVIADFLEMRGVANEASAVIRAILQERLDILRDNTRSAQRALAWQAAALAPAALLLVGFFILLVARPLRLIDRAIRELGEGDFSRSIAISGPADIETLGRKLEWL